MTSQFEKFFQRIENTENDYYWPLYISRETAHEIHLKRSPSSCFVNNYNPVLQESCSLMKISQKIGLGCLSQKRNLKYC